jgi:hypothetical protein
LKAAEAADEFDQVFRGRIDQLGSSNLASELMGKGRNYVSGQLKDFGIRVRDALASLEVLGDPLPEEAFHTAFSRLGVDPVLYLEAAREPQPMAPDLYFREIAPRVAALGAAGASPGGVWPTRARKLEKLDKLRRRDRQLAKERLQQMISSMVERMETKGERPRVALGELAAALVVLASLQRYAGRRGDAADLLAAARPLSIAAADCLVEGDWYVKAAMLLVDLNRDARAYQFLLEAGSLFFLAGSAAKQAEAAVGRAYVLTHAGHHAESQKLLEQVLPLIGEGQEELRLFAHQTLAKNLRERGFLAESCRQLQVAIELTGDDPMAHASCLWIQAKLFDRLGNVAGAMAALKAALPLVARLAGAAELAEMAMEYARLLLKEGRRPELRALAADLSSWIQQLRGTKKLRVVVEDFRALIELGELSEDGFLEILKRLQVARPAALRKKEGRGEARGA